MRVLLLIFVFLFNFHFVNATTAGNHNPRPCPSPECCLAVKGPSNCSVVNKTHYWSVNCMCDGIVILHNEGAVFYSCCILSPAVIDNACYQIEDCERIKQELVDAEINQLKYDCETEQMYRNCGDQEDGVKP